LLSFHHHIIIIIIVWLVLEWTLLFPRATSIIHAEASLMENTSAEMSPVARHADAGKLGGRKPEE